MKKNIPLHQAVRQTTGGVFIKEVSPAANIPPVTYAHRDDYYIFGMIRKGTCRISIDFCEREAYADEIICVRPGQVHQILESGDAQAFLLFVDSALVDTDSACILSEYALFPFSFQPDAVIRQEFLQLFDMIRRHQDISVSPVISSAVVRNLAGALVGIVTSALQVQMSGSRHSRRQVEIMLAFQNLLAGSATLNRDISYYAGCLHLSAVYLNEVVRKLTGVSVGRYLQNELMLRARRMLIYTTLTVKEIGQKLGVEDPSYFTRMFVRSVGMSPTAFRRKYLG
jgi:AraC family transcriptional activator of pobA